jgi:hypothetical protein
MNKINVSNIETDFINFSRQHSWYKHLPTISHYPFYVFPIKSQINLYIGFF